MIKLLLAVTATSLLTPVVLGLLFAAFSGIANWLRRSIAWDFRTGDAGENSVFGRADGVWLDPARAISDSRAFLYGLNRRSKSNSQSLPALR